MKVRGKLKGAAIEAAPFAASVLVRQRSFRRLSGQLSQWLGQVLSIMKEKHSPRPSLHEEGDQRSVRFGRVAIPAGENQVVGPVIGRLTPARPHVIERDCVISGLGAAIRANWTVLCEKPIAV